MKLRGGNGPTMRVAQLSDVAGSALQFPTRAPNSMPEGWVFGVSGFSYTAPEPEALI
jgi:hypothetical protein